MPIVEDGKLQIVSRCSLISAGTERMLIEFGKDTYIQKAKKHPDKVKQVLDKVTTDGLLPTIDAIKSKLSRPLPMGYSNVGRVVAVGKGVTGFAVGDRIASNGYHAEVINVSPNLCAKIPHEVTDEEATLTVQGAIALQGVRLANPTIGESFVVMGLGLIGLLTAQILRANGCRVLGLDTNEHRCQMAGDMGIETISVDPNQDVVSGVRSAFCAPGVDGVLITLSSDSNEPVHQAAEMCRKRGRIILVGVSGLNLSRADFFEKELSFQVSCSYGPGRYEAAYEKKGLDYPIGFVRWTEKRNFEAVLELIRSQKVDVSSLITHRFRIQDAKLAYLEVDKQSSALGILLEYSRPMEELKPKLKVVEQSVAPHVARVSEGPKVSFIGAGNHATRVLMPAFKKAGAHMRSVTSAGGASSLFAHRKYQFDSVLDSASELYSDDQTQVLVISSPHNFHAEQVVAAWDTGKNVFVEKPLCITLEELDRIESTCSQIREKPSDEPKFGHPRLMVGFNRRFSPLVSKIKTIVDRCNGCKSIVITVNAGSIPADHWTQDREVGGGRLIGEACHFLDLVRYLSDSKIASANVVGIPDATKDTFTIQTLHENGDIGTVHYFANGARSFPKERVEIFRGGGILQIDNYRVLRGYNWPGFKCLRLWRQNKGNHECVSDFVSAIRQSRPSPIPFSEIVEVSRIAIELAGELA